MKSNWKPRPSPHTYEHLIFATEDKARNAHFKKTASSTKCLSNWVVACRKIQTDPYLQSCTYGSKLTSIRIKHETSYTEPDIREGGKELSLPLIDPGKDTKHNAASTDTKNNN